MRDQETAVGGLSRLRTRKEVVYNEKRLISLAWSVPNLGFDPPKMRNYLKIKDE